MLRITQKLFFSCFIALGILCLTSCSSTKVEDYASETPTLILSEYFNGNTKAYGIFTDRGGKVVKRFTVDIQSTWAVVDGVKTGTLDESFLYSDGTTQKRIWTIKEISKNQFEGTAADVVGKATGVASGNALNWSYTLLLPVDGKNIEVQFNDWMYLVNSKVMLNRAQMTKFGIYLGEVTLSFTKD
ncbi:MAG: DUF3833 domain-containing protein [Betaproteobacteria bacterium]